MQDNVTHRLSAHPGFLAFNLDHDNLKSQGAMPIASLQRINGVRNTPAPIEAEASSAIYRRYVLPLTAGRARRHSSVKSLPLTADTIARNNAKLINEQMKRVPRKLVNLSESADIQNEYISRGVWTEYNLSLLKALLGTAIQPGAIATLSPPEQLRKLIIIMDNFQHLERNHKLFVFQRLKSLFPPSVDNVNLTQRQFQLLGKCLAYFSRHCLRHYPIQFFPQVYDYLFQTVSRFTTVNCNVIIRQLLKHFPVLCQQAPPATLFQYFKSLLEASFLCSSDVRNYIFNGLSKNLIFLPDNLVKDGAILMELCSRKFMSKRFNQKIEKNISYCLKEELAHYKLDILNSTFYSPILTAIK
ncbi:hypothetical protein ACL2XO_18470 [Sodalis sp. RH15]|uniref:hypothetical protein n=1 Tax=Sodalis sp. RH15 TaxID=3394330 RepID=UPI0039B611CB